MSTGSSNERLLSPITNDCSFRCKQSNQMAESQANQCGEASDSRFTSSQGQLLVGETKFTIRVLKMNGATMIFLSATEPECLDEMAVAMKMPQDGQIIGTTILGAQGTSTDSQRMAEQLTKRFERQFFVSYNVQVDRMMAPLLEKQLSEYVRNNREEFV